jgi:hypothetical protein
MLLIIFVKIEVPTPAFLHQMKIDNQNGHFTRQSNSSDIINVVLLNSSMKL